MLRKTWAPTDDARSDAPTIATDRGSKTLLK
jgi:hypothetical protein